MPQGWSLTGGETRLQQEQSPMQQSTQAWSFSVQGMTLPLMSSLQPLY